MENILELYGLPYDSDIPLVCFDEKPYQLLNDKFKPLPMKQGKTAREDYEYIREGTCSIFVFVQPLKGWRRVEALERRTKVDFAHQIEKLLLEDFPDVKKVRCVTDNLRTCLPSSQNHSFNV